MLFAVYSGVPSTMLAKRQTQGKGVLPNPVGMNRIWPPYIAIISNAMV
jgi:hypothetical protein